MAAIQAIFLDGHPAHIAKAVAQYVQSLEGRLELYFLPGYAPELNPGGQLSAVASAATPQEASGAAIAGRDKGTSVRQQRRA